MKLRPFNKGLFKKVGKVLSKALNFISVKEEFVFYFAKKNNNIRLFKKKHKHN